MLRQIDDLRMEGNPAWKDLMRKHTPGILFQIDWHRVVLDEAHRITTRSSQSTWSIPVIKFRGQPGTNALDSVERLYTPRQALQLGPHRNTHGKQH
jgi:hypothetical protein